MSLVIAPDAGFNSLVSLSEAAGYMSDLGHLDWPVDVVAQEVALRRATQYILSFYSIKPEHLDPVAERVQWACCEAAVRAANGSLFTDVDAQAVTEESVGPITTKYAAPINSGQKRFGIIDALLRGFTTSDANNLRLIRG